MNKKPRLNKVKLNFKGRLLNLYLKPFRFPNGHFEILEVIRHPGAALIVAYTKEKKILFLRQFRPVINKFIWELPAGTISKMERAIDCAKRELQEETGFRALRWKYLGQIYPAPGYTNEKIYVYRASLLKKTEVARQKDELLSVKALTFEQIQKLFKKGKIIDAKTICALVLAGVNLVKNNK